MKKHLIGILLLGLIMALPSIATYGQQKKDNPGTSSETIITVGQTKGDIIGSDNRAIQAAIDMVGMRGGGTVHILQGEYILNDALHLRSNITLTGDGPQKTILKHAPSISSPLLKDADIGQKEATPKDPSLFKVGMGIAIRSTRHQNEMANQTVNNC